MTFSSAFIISLINRKGLLNCMLETFKFDYMNSKLKSSQRPVRSKVNVRRNQSLLKIKTSKLLEARENAGELVATVFSSACDWFRG